MKQLTDFLSRYSDTVFDYNKFTCAFFTCDWIKEVRGVDPASGMRLVCNDEYEMKRLLKQYKSLKHITIAYFKTINLKPVHRNFAKRGDIILFNRNSWTLGVLGTQGIVSPSLKGLMYTPITNAVFAWKV